MSSRDAGPTDAPRAGAGPVEAKAHLEAWPRLLEFLARDGASPAAAYEAMRERLVKFFVWRGGQPADDLADETLTRVAAKLAIADVQAERPVAFVLGVARLIHLEWKRREGRWVRLDDDDRAGAPLAADGDEPDDELLAALYGCLEHHAPEDRRLILRYHNVGGLSRGPVRQSLADELAIELGTLRVRMHRLRQQIEACVERRLAARRA